MLVSFFFRRNFSETHINLTLYTVNEPWLYSVLWCSGVPSVSSEAPNILRKVPYPIWLMVRTRDQLSSFVRWLFVTTTSRNDRNTS